MSLTGPNCRLLSLGKNTGEQQVPSKALFNWNDLILTSTGVGDWRSADLGESKPLAGPVWSGKGGKDVAHML